MVAELSREDEGQLHIPEDRAGVVVRDVVGLSPDVEALAHGDVVVEVNRQPTPDLAAYRKVVAALRARRAGLALRVPAAPGRLVPGQARGRGAP